MKTLLNLIFFLLISNSLFAQRTVDHLGISTGNIDVTSETTVGELTIKKDSSTDHQSEDKSRRKLNPYWQDFSLTMN